MSRSTRYLHAYQVLYRHGRGKAEEEGQVVLHVDLNGGPNVGERESASDDGEGTRGEEDSKSLISEEEEIDEDGVARDYEVALKHIGFGLFHVILILINGVALLSDAVEVISVGFVLPILQKKEGFEASDVENAVLSSVIFAGMLVGSYGWGGFADVVGRRCVLLGSLTLNGVFGVISAFSPNIAMFIVCRFISGIGVGGSLPVIFPYIAEFTRNKYRGPYMAGQSFFWTFGRLLCGGLAWIILPLTISRFHSWRLFIILASLPALIGALLYFLLPESPRYLLEHGQEKKALKALRMVHKLNHWHRGDCQFRIKHFHGLVREDSVEEVANRKTLSQRLAALSAHTKQVFHRTRELYSRKLMGRTILLNTILFTLAFGAYGISLWFPSYVGDISNSERRHEFKSFCGREVPASGPLSDYCGCEWTRFSGQNFADLEISNFKLTDSVFHNVKFTNVTFSDISLKRCNFTECVLENVWFKSQCSFDRVSWNQTVFSGVNTSGLDVCDGKVVEGECGDNCEGVGVDPVTVLEGRNNSCEDGEVECEEKDSSTVYRDLFLVSASSFPGNIASAFAVYYLRRNYWMAMSMSATTLSVFALYLVRSEVYVVVILCVFTALSTPAWNDSSLLIAELYPTHLRSTSMGVHLMFARVGAIIGTNLFGLFIHVNPSIPILLVASVLLVGSLASLPLPKTTRKTILQ